MNQYDIIIVGGGQSGLACGYFLHRTNLKYLILDDQPGCGGAWTHVWDSLTLFSPAEYSSLPGRMMPKSKNTYPVKQEVTDYLCSYEASYNLNIKRPVRVISVKRLDSGFELETDNGIYNSKTMISATGCWQRPFIPKIEGMEQFKGEQVHSAHYRNPEAFIGQKVLIVGGGNSGAQVLAELSKVTLAHWATLKDPTYLPDDVDGRVLFNVATARYNALKAGKEFNAADYSLGNIVMVPSVKEARQRGALKSNGNFNKFIERGVVWEDGKEEHFDVVIWCTGFMYATQYLKDIVMLDKNGKAATQDTRSRDKPGLWFVGYGNWTGFASATLIGVGRSARETIKQIQEYLKVPQ
jgi:putative flavoprotein involved in K+ transport